MPSKYRKRRKIKYTTEELRRATDAIVPVARGVVEQLIQRCQEIAAGNDKAPRRSRGRGSQLKPTEELLVMFWAQTVSDRPRAIAAALGMHPRTVARVLSSKKYKKVDEAVAAQTLASIGGVRGLMRNLNRDW